MPIRPNSFVGWPRNDYDMPITLAPLAKKTSPLCVWGQAFSNCCATGPLVLLEQSATTYNTSDAPFILLCKNETQRTKHGHHRIGYFWEVWRFMSMSWGKKVSQLLMNELDLCLSVCIIRGTTSSDTVQPVPTFTKGSVSPQVDDTSPAKAMRLGIPENPSNLCSKFMAGNSLHQVLVSASLGQFLWWMLS